MKNCMICHHVNEDAAPTCPKCGEASWGPSTAPAPAVEEAPAEAPKRRSRK